MFAKRNIRNTSKIISGSFVCSSGNILFIIMLRRFVLPIPQVLIQLVTYNRRWHRYILCMTFPVLQFCRGRFSCVHKNVSQRKRDGTPKTMNLCKQGTSTVDFEFFLRSGTNLVRPPRGPFSNQLLLMSYSGLLFKLVTWARRVGIPDVLSSCITCSNACCPLAKSFFFSSQNRFYLICHREAAVDLAMCIC